MGKKAPLRQKAAMGFVGLLFLIAYILILSPETLAKEREKDLLGKICKKSLVYKMANSPIKRRTYHILKMKGACQKVLLSKKNPVQESKNQGNSFQSLLQSEYSSWGVDPVFKDSWINPVGAWKSFKARRDVVVAVIDTGVDPNHKYIKDNIHVLEGIKGSSNYGMNFSAPGPKFSRIPIDNHGHGTHVSGILKSVYHQVKILPIKYYNPSLSGQQNLKSLIRSLKYAINAGVDIINYSGGGPEPAIEELKILKEAERKGILLVVAAGNETADIDRRDKAFYPASYGLSNIVSVAAHNQKTNILQSSNWGKSTVDLSAPGHRIRSSVPYNRSSYMSGTSQATAFVSGVAAMIKSQYPNLSAQDIKIILRRSVSKVDGLKKKCAAGGKLDATRALAVAKKYSQGQGKRSKAFVIPYSFGFVEDGFVSSRPMVSRCSAMAFAHCDGPHDRRFPSTRSWYPF